MKTYRLIIVFQLVVLISAGQEVEIVKNNGALTFHAAAYLAIPGNDPDSKNNYKRAELNVEHEATNLRQAIMTII